MVKHFKPLLAAVLLLLPLLYVGSYALIVDPHTVIVTCGHDNSPAMPLYRVGGEYAARFYWPLETIDRRLRPVTWHEPSAFPLSVPSVPFTAPAPEAQDPFDTAAVNPFE